MQPSPEQFIDALLDSIDGAFSANSRTAYRGDFLHYANWISTTKFSLFPVTAEAVASYIAAMQRVHKSATIRRRVDALSSICFFAKLEDPTKSPEVTLALKRMHRQIGRHQKQAYPLTWDLIEQMLTRCDDSLTGQRNQLLLRLGYETMRRRAEICSFHFEDLQQLPDGNCGLFLRFSKTDQTGEGRLIPISDKLSNLINAWGERIHTDHGQILRAVRRGDNLAGPLRSVSINAILVDLQYRSRLRHLPKLSGHSFRVGAALDLLRAGVPIEKIMLRGGWSKESTTLRYLQSWVDDVNPADLDHPATSLVRSK